MPQAHNIKMVGRSTELGKCVARLSSYNSSYKNTPVKTIMVRTSRCIQCRFPLMGIIFLFISLSYLIQRHPFSALHRSFDAVSTLSPHFASRYFSSSGLSTHASNLISSASSASHTHTANDAAHTINATNAMLQQASTVGETVHMDVITAV